MQLSPNLKSAITLADILTTFWERDAACSDGEWMHIRQTHESITSLYTELLPVGFRPIYYSISNPARYRVGSMPNIGDLRIGDFLNLFILDKPRDFKFKRRFRPMYWSAEVG